MTQMINVSVGVPTSIASLLNVETWHRLLTLEFADDFSKCSRDQKQSIILRVMMVGLLALGIGCSVAIMSPLAVWAIPLSMIVAMGLSLNLLTMHKQQKECVYLHWGKGHSLKEESSNNSCHKMKK